MTNETYLKTKREVNLIKLVYICSPLGGDIERNISRANGYCRFAATLGVIPIAPHVIFTQFLDEEILEERQLGMQMGLDIMYRCAELWVFGSKISKGMQGEIEAAERLGIPIQYYSDRCVRRENLTGVMI